MPAETEQTTTEIVVVEPDWKAIRERYLQGEELAPLAEEYGTTVNAISVRAYRQAWRDDQAKLLLRDEALLSKEIRGNILVSILRESRFFQRQDPVRNPIEQDLWSKIRARLVDTAGKLLGWDQDPLANAKRVKPIDV